jgi:ferredoxin
MGGLGYGLRSSKYINIVNPASFSEADTLTMLFEAGVSLQNVNFKEGDKRINAKNASLEYLAMQFRIRKGLGMSIGFLPYSRVGYSFSKVSNDGAYESSTDSYNGSGGIYQPYIGIAWKPLKNLSVGVTGSYIYGDITHDVTINFVNSTSLRRIYNASIKSYKLDLGIQYITKLAEKHTLTLGAVYSFFNRISVLRIRNDEQRCIGCKKCENACKMNVSVLSEPDSAECIRCGLCVKNCPTQRLSMGFSLKNGEKEVKEKNKKIKSE